VPAGSAATREERKGPRVGAPEKAVEGFLRGAGLASIDDATDPDDPKKGDFYVAVIEKPGRSAIDIIAEFMPGVLRNFPWPKSMRWGTTSTRWVRPLHSIIATFGPETEEPDVVPFEFDGIKSGKTTRGHRFLADIAFDVRRFDDYAPALEKHKVVLGCGPPQGHHRQMPRTARWRLVLNWSKIRASGRSRRSGRMAGCADRVLRRGVPGNPGRVHPADHQGQSEVLRVEGPEYGQTRQQVRSHLQHRCAR
jgi:hypothetical protein